MGRATTATIHLDAIRANYLLAKSVAKHAKAMAIIKADAYGHGAVPVAKGLSNIADAFGVACIEEALELREAGIENPILLLEGFFTTDELPIISAQNLWSAVHSLEQIDDIANSQLSAPINVWLKMDSGMHRLGVAPQDFKMAYDKLKSLDNVADVILMSHFASADDLTDASTAAQVALFEHASEGIDAGISLANSAGTLGHDNARREWQRPGIMLYGATPFDHAHPLADQLQAGMSLTSKVIAVREVPAGEAVGYSATYVCDKPTIVGTVAMGYADGYPRHAVSGTPVIVNGQRTQIIGRVSMDMITVDLTHIKDAHVGADVEFWGKNLPAAEVAPYCNTIPYTLFTGITRRVHKVYAGAEQ